MKTLIKNGWLVDPSCHRNERMDLLITDGKVSEVAKNLKDREAECDSVIDATGKIVTPGFVDIHMHEDPVDTEGKIEYGIFNNMLRMGVTTAVGGNCGSSCIDPVEYLDIVDRDGAPCNVAMFVGEISLRRLAGAVDKYAPSTQEQCDQIRKAAEKALEGGCVGVSYGVRYAPGSDERELMAAGAACQKSGKIVAAHVRDDADEILPSIEEIAAIGRRYDLPVQISHIGSMGGFGQMKSVMDQIMKDREEGLDIALDCYPYEAFSTEIGATTYDDGWMERYHCDYSALEFASGKYRGKRADAASFADMRANDPDALTVCYVMKKEDVELALMHPLVCLGSDGILDHGQGHPRAAGSFPRFYKNFAATGKLPVEEVVRKMTTMAAERLGLTGKGTLMVGSDGDVTILDPHRISDNATFEQPGLPPDGIEFVLIGGEIACDHGKISENYHGRSVRVSLRR